MTEAELTITLSFGAIFCRCFVISIKDGNPYLSSTNAIIPPAIAHDIRLIPAFTAPLTCDDIWSYSLATPAPELTGRQFSCIHLPSIIVYSTTYSTCL